MASGLTWLRNGAGENGLLPLNYPSSSLFPWMQQRMDLSMLGTDQNQQYQAMLAAGMQNIGSGSQYVQLQDPNQQYLQQSAAVHNSDLLLHQHQQASTEQQQIPCNLLQAQTQILTENLPQQNMRQEAAGQPQQPDRVWQHSDLLSSSFMKSDFTDLNNKFTSTSANPVQQRNCTLQGSGDSSSLLNFSITGQCVQSDQSPTQVWSLKHTQPESNDFSEPLSLRQAYGGTNPSMEPPNPQSLSLFGVDSDSGLFLPTTVPRFGNLSADADTSSIPLPDSGFPNSLFGSSQDIPELSHGAGQTNNFVKVYKSGSVGRSLDISRFSSYGELIEELGKMFDIKGLLEDTFRSGWQLVFVDKEDDILLLGDDPWESFVNSVWYIKILSPEDVSKMGEHDEGIPQNPTHF